MIKKEDLHGRLRVFVLDSLVAHSAQPLSPDLIGRITQEIVERAMDILEDMFPEDEAFSPTI